MKRVLTLLFVTMSLIAIERVSNAAVYQIGSAIYGGGTYNLIYEGQLGGTGLVWLDYSSPQNTWQNQVNWASELSSSLTQIALDSGYQTTINWSTEWRLPTTTESKINLYGPWGESKGDGTGFGWGGPDENGYHDYYWGYNFENSEMAHLYYLSLGNLGYISKDGTWEPTEWGLGNIGEFQSLFPDVYWSSTGYSPDTANAWRFNFDTGGQNINDQETYYFAMAVHPGSVSSTAVPIPGSAWLLGSSIIGLIGIKRRSRR